METGGDKLTDLLRRADDLEPNCLNRALKAATLKDSSVNIGNLVMRGAKNHEECLKLAQKENKPHAHAVLLLIRAALTGDELIVKKLFGAINDDLEESSDPGFPDVRRAVLSGKVSTVVPIEIARKNGHHQVREELLLKTDVNEMKGYVYWHGLRLLQLEIAWLRRINWVKQLMLTRNGFKTLPKDLGNYLKQVRITSATILLAIYSYIVAIAISILKLSVFFL